MTLKSKFIRQLKQLAENYGIALSTLSTWIFNDGKIIPRLLKGHSVTLDRYEHALKICTKLEQALEEEQKSRQKEGKENLK